MYVPATLGQPTAALAPVGIVSMAPEVAVKPLRTALQVRQSRLNVLNDHRVSVAGSFNQWDATAAPLAPSGAAGVWTATVAVPVGQHQYAFLVDGRRWVSDPGAPTVDDGFGRRNSVVSVAAAGARAL